MNDNAVAIYVSSSGLKRFRWTIIESKDIFGTTDYVAYIDALLEKVQYI
jgi:hypothetical protein